MRNRWTLRGSRFDESRLWPPICSMDRGLAAKPGMHGHELYAIVRGATMETHDQDPPAPLMPEETPEYQSWIVRVVPAYAAAVAGIGGCFYLAFSHTSGVLTVIAAIMGTAGVTAGIKTFQLEHYLARYRAEQRELERLHGQLRLLDRQNKRLKEAQLKQLRRRDET